MKPSSPDAGREALRAWRREARRTLIALAIAAEAPPDPPAAELGLLDLSSALRPPDPGGWTGALEHLLDGALGQALAAHGLDPATLLLHELLFQERVPASPPFALYEARQGPSPAWGALLEALEARDGIRAAQRAWRVAQALRQDLPLSADERALLEDAGQRLGAQAPRGVLLTRRAAAEADQVGAYAPAELAVRGADGWALDLELTRGRRDWMLEGRLRWTGDGPTPTPPSVALRVQDTTGAVLVEASQAAGAGALLAYHHDLPRELLLDACVVEEDR